MILILGGAWQGKLTWAASHGMVGPVFDLKDGWPEAPVRCCRHLEALTRAASDRGETAQQMHLSSHARSAPASCRSMRRSAAGARCTARCCRALRPERSTSAGYFADWRNG